MQPERKRQLDELIRAFRADGYDVRPIIKEARNCLLLYVILTAEDVEELTTQHPDFRRVEG